MTLRLPYRTPAQRVIGFAPDQVHTDINLYPNPIPVNNPVQNTQSGIPSIVWVTSPNIALTTVVVTQNPFYTQDFSTTHVIPDYLPSPQYPNLVLQQFSTPFVNQWASTTSNRTLPNNNVPNIVLLNPIVTQNPFYSNDFSKPFTPAGTKSDNYPNIVLLNPPVVAGTPFNQLIWPNTYGVNIAPLDVYNIMLVAAPPTPAPFYTQDFSTVYRIKGIVPDNFPNIVLNAPVVTQRPFGPYDWGTSTTFFTSRAGVGPQTTNLSLLFPNPIPFVSYDWSKPLSVKASIDTQYPNLLLVQPSIPGKPLGINGWIDWSYVKGPVILVSDQNNLPNIVLLVTPPAPPPPDVIHSGKWRWLEGYNDLVEPRKNIAGDIKKAAAVLSQMGGHARAAALTAKQRTNIATTAANTRWGKR